MWPEVGPAVADLRTGDVGALALAGLTVANATRAVKPTRDIANKTARDGAPAFANTDHQPPELDRDPVPAAQRISFRVWKASVTQTVFDAVTSVQEME